MKTTVDEESRAVARLIAEIDAIDRWRDRVGRRVIVLFALVFAVALGLLGWVATQEAIVNAPSGLR